MEESIYGDIDRHPIMDHADGAGEFVDDYYPCAPPPQQCNLPPPYWKDQELACLDEQHRIPLLALQWHDYVAATWNWRNSTFVVESLSWKKDLFNILYCGMPMWHVTNELWTNHKAEYIGSYFKLLPVRKANGFAEMTNHGWLSKDPINFPTDRSIQYTYWDNSNHVIVNFDDTNPHTFTDPDYGSINILPKGYALLPDLISENCDGSGTPTGWANSGTTPNWDYAWGTGNQGVYFYGTGSGGSATKVNFANQPEVYIYFKLRLTAASTATKTIGGVAQNAGSVQQTLQINSSNQLSFGGAQTVTALSTNTTYHVWLHYRQGTPSNSNGVVDIGFSTDGIKPTSGNRFAKSITNGGTNDAGRLFLGPSTQSSFDMIVDSIRVAYAEIGNAP
jgi:hypothetical protein